MCSKTMNASARLFWCLALAGLSGCAGFTSSGSANVAPMLEQFPFRASQPLARELRYTYTDIQIINGKPGRPSYAADAKTLAAASPDRGPGAILAIAARVLAQENAFATDGARLQAGVTTTGAGDHLAGALTFGIAPYIGMHQFVEAMTQKTAHALGLWVHDGTAAVGTQAPEGSQLQLDFVSIWSVRGQQGESRFDSVVLGKLVDGSGRTFVSNRAMQIYVHSEPPKTPLPPDAVRLQRGFLPPEKVDLAKGLEGGRDRGFAVLASAAVAELYRQAGITK
jgi:hypothetical protein